MDLSDQNSIGSALLIEISVPGEPVTYFSTYWRDLTIGDVTYTGLGSLLSITATQNDLRVTEQSLTIGISGLVSDNVQLVRSSPVRGSPIVIKRYVFDPVTGVGLDIADNPTGRFHGIIANWSMEFTASNQDRSGEVNIILECASTVSIMANKIAGRRTNGEDQRRLYPTDFCFDRVANLADSNIDFGVPRP